MIRHIVQWKLDARYEEDEKLKISKEIQVQLMALDTKIEELKKIRVYANSKKASTENFDVMLDTTFDSFADLEKYQIHPEHKEVVKYMKTLKMKRAAIDFEI